MFPKTQFRDTVDRVERVCRSRRMQINMSIWKDSERRIDEEKGDPNKSDSSDLDQDGTSKAKDTSPQNPTSSAPTQAQPIRRIIDPEDDDDMWLDVDDALESLEQAKAPETNKPPVAVDDDDLEDWFKADDGAPKDMDIDSTKPDTAPSRFLSPPTAENWDDDLYA
ncbi:hypothetical protein CPB86DRAFT_566496 [Serendipita vermifera]|nr:hypothetical protein CPB86DRAFT_566496 [Serendipita vermifera]